MTFAATITSCGAIRSAITPPTSRKTSDGAACAAITYDRSAVEPVAARTAKETPTSENVAARGASRRSASSNLKLRLAMVGKRRVSARVSMSNIQSDQVGSRPPDPIWAGQGRHNRFSATDLAGSPASHTARPAAGTIWLLRRRSPNTLQRRKCPTPPAATAGADATFPHEPDSPDLQRADRDPTTTTAVRIGRVCMQAVGHAAGQSGRSRADSGQNAAIEEASRP